MSLKKLASELDETARQTARMVDGIVLALATLSDKSITTEAARTQAIDQIVTALQAQDRIEQRCRNIAIAARHFARLPPGTPDAAFEAVWRSLELDELRIPALSGVAENVISGEPELF